MELNSDRTVRDETPKARNVIREHVRILIHSHLDSILLNKIKNKTTATDCDLHCLFPPSVNGALSLDA